MPKEYRTIQEVAGPLMMVRGVEGVAYDELGEIELVNGETRRCKVLEVDGDTVLVQLLKARQESTFRTARYVSLEEAWSLVYQKTCSAVSLTDWDVRSTAGRKSFRKRDWM